MTKNEWDKCFVWLVEGFPSWRPSAATSAVWYEELGAHVTPERFKQIVRQHLIANPAKFPPAVFELVHQACESQAPTQESAQLIVETEWEKVLWNREVEDERTRRAFQAIGRRPDLRFVQFSELTWIKKEFIQAWMVAHGAQEKIKFAEAGHYLASAQHRRIGGPAKNRNGEGNEQ